MLRVEWLVFVRQRRFALLSGAPLLIALLSAFSQYAAAQVGLLYTTGYAFIVRTLNLYAVLFLPFLSVSLAAYLILAEFQWRTIRRPFVEHIPRTRFLLAKTAITGVMQGLLMLPYGLLTLTLAAALFGLQPVLFEDVELSVGQSLLRPLLAYGWIGLELFWVMLLSQMLALRTRNMLLAVLGGLLVFYGLVVFGESLPLPPLRWMMRFSARLLEARALASLVAEGARALAVWAALVAGTLVLHVRLFRRQDVTVA